MVAPDDALITRRSLRFDEVSPLLAFTVLLENMFRYNPNITVFVASNSASAKTLIINSFPAGRIVAITDEFDRSDKEGIISAMVDFYLLAQTDVIVHSRGSSFAREAAAVNGISVIDVTQTMISLCLNSAVFKIFLIGISKKICGVLALDLSRVYCIAIMRERESSAQLSILYVAAVEICVLSRMYQQICCFIVINSNILLPRAAAGIELR